MQKLHELYGGQATGASTAMPNGKFKNRLFTADLNGTPLEMGWANNMWGALSGIMKMAGITANDSEENADNSQVARGVKAIATEVLRKSFKYGTTSNPTGLVDCHALLRTARVSEDFYPDLSTGVLIQQNFSANNSVDLPLPYGRFLITYFNAYVVNHVSSGSNPLVLRLRRRNVVSNTVQTLSTITYNTGSNLRGEVLSPYHQIESGYVYYVHIEAQSSSGAPDLQIRDIWVNLDQDPVTL